MRFGTHTLSALLAMPLLACAADAEPAPEETPRLLAAGHLPTSEGTTAPTPPAPTSSVTPLKAPAPIDPATLTHPEAVYLIMPGKADGLIWFCTGALISKNTVVTAAHCLQPSLFASWEVVAPTLPNKPRVKALSTKMFDTNWKDVGHPDIGIVKLETAIDLPQYAQLTDATNQVDSGEKLVTATIVRKSELPEAPFQKKTDLRLTSTIDYGYDHGFGVPIYSHGGDSGAGMFLVENGQMTHKLVGVEREPDPARKIDHLTRVEPTFIDWVRGTAD